MEGEGKHGFVTELSEELLWEHKTSGKSLVWVWWGGSRRDRELFPSCVPIPWESKGCSSPSLQPALPLNSFSTGNDPGETWERDSHPKNHPGPAPQGSELMDPS